MSGLVGYSRRLAVNVGQRQFTTRAQPHPARLQRIPARWRIGAAHGPNKR
jgi:hypothetical protein